ncbi:MAG TPA: DUF4199 domain-containing protein [Thermoanaerobaculia bacterium]|nr:DUF4199 domain-containing protein [Thermoanaerobaculia bacterium]
MKNIVLKYGLISGALLAILTAIMLPLCLNGTIPFENSELIGYSTMVLSFIAVFFGIRAYRENVGNGRITFGRAFKVGILITLITCAVYVIGWEIVYWNFLPDFGETYARLSTERMRNAGASAADIAQHQQRMAQFMEWYKNPFFNVGMTFLEVFPVGLLVTLISAAILRKKPEDRAGAPVTA